MAGYVYLIGTPTFGWYKIGKSISPEVRVKDLGILLPFKLSVIGIFKAEDHTLLERTLHEIYSNNRINGEWFEFTKKGVYSVFESIPPEAIIYPTQGIKHSFDRFSNIEQDTKNSKKVIGVRVQKLRGHFTSEERDQLRLISMRHEVIRKKLKKIKGYNSNRTTWNIICNQPCPESKPKINMFTYLIWK